jgi:hypothetical protein
VGHFFGLRFDFALDKEDFDTFWIVVRDEFRVTQLVDEWLASACEVVCIK